MPSTSSKRRRPPSSSQVQSQDYLQPNSQSQASAHRRQQLFSSHPRSGTLPTPQADPDVVITDVDNTKPPFRPGNITRLMMKNFLTFSDVVFKPGPRMNLIIGPNGTGKSTIVSAVCIVFGGKPTLLGRSPDLGSFVKFGTSEATVEVWLYEPEHDSRHISVRRVFDSDGKSRFFLNNVSCRQADIIEKVVQTYDIQLDNMSQFMPQEKIAEFTNHRPDELLKLAVRSLGGVSREDLYAELIELDKRLQSHTGNLKQTEASLAMLEAQQQDDEPEVEAFRAQQQLREKVKVLEMFRPVVAEIELRATYNKIRDEMKAIEAEINALDLEMKRSNTGPINACQQRVDVSKQACRAAKTATMSAETKNDQHFSVAEDLSNKLSMKAKEWKEVELSAEKTRTAIVLAEEKLTHSLASYEQMKDVPDETLDQQQQELDGKRLELRGRRRDEEQKKAPLEQDKLTASRAIHHHQNSLNGLGDVRLQRLALLAKKDTGRKVIECEKLVHNLRSQNAFVREVYGPVLLEIEVSNAYHARIMEHAVSGFLSMAFVMQSGRDARTLLDACRKHLNGWKPDTITAPTTSNDELDLAAIRNQRAFRPVDPRLRSLGIECTVSDIYTAPDAVRWALNAQASLQNIYVGNERAIEAQDGLRQERDVSTWYTPDSRCQVSGSRFDNRAKNLRVDTSFVNSTGETYSGNAAEAERRREELKHRIRTEEEKMNNANNELYAIVARQNELAEQARELQSQIEDLVAKRSERRTAFEKVEALRRHVHSLKERAARKDVAKEKALLTTTTRLLEDKAVKAVVRLTDGLQQLHEAMDRMDEALVESTCAGRALAKEQAVHEEALKTRAMKKEERDKLKRTRDRVKSDWRRKKEDSDRAFTEDQRRDYAEMLQPYFEKTAEDLEQDISDLEGQVQGLTSSGPAVLEAYEHRQRRINQMRETIARERGQFAAQEDDLKNRTAEFLTWLQGGIERMRAKFSDLYTRLGCSGDLRLTNGEGGSLGDLTLEVLVSYRNDVELRPVSAMANSGGEKMCCTMIFCFSLQLEEERIPPFVMVDELNQGLDPSNEMKIMTMMIEDASEQMASQSFVVTPKLLPNLPLVNTLYILSLCSNVVR